MAKTEQFRVYEVADRAGAGVRVQLEYQPAPNLALATSGVPVLRALAVHNETGAALTAIGVEGPLRVRSAGGGEVLCGRRRPERAGLGRPAPA